MKAIRILTAVLAAAVAAPAAAISIPDAKASANATVVANVAGTVIQVGGSTNRRQFVIADNTGVGVVIDNSSSVLYTQPAVGDSVNIVSSTKTTFNGIIQLQPPTVGDVQIISNANLLPAPIVFNSLTSFLATGSSTTGNSVRIKNVYVTGTIPANGGATTWLSGVTGGVNWTMTDDGTTQVVVRVASDMNGVGTTYQTKTRPVLGDTNDKVDVVGTTSIFNGIPQILIANPAGTTAKTDATGPIRATSARVREWDQY